MRHSQVLFNWDDRPDTAVYRAAVSLHGHTSYSSEQVADLGRWLESAPWLTGELRRVRERFRDAYGQEPDFNRAIWTPPPNAREAHALESRAIASALGLAPLVSLSDHDSIEAGCHLQMLEDAQGAPISLEWSVPFGPGCLHLGLHNLPAGDARSIAAQLADCGQRSSERRLKDLLAEIDRIPDALIVLNHPLRDDAGMGVERHRALLGRFLTACRGQIHAIEVNGRRPWSENREAIDLAYSCERAIVSGGDRHGFEPAAILNLTKRSSFSEFVAEVRDGVSDVLVMDHYREPLAIRNLALVREALAEYPDRPGRVRWSDRVLIALPSGGTAPLSSLFVGRDRVAFRRLELTMLIAEAPGIRPLLRLWFSRELAQAWGRVGRTRGAR